MSRQSRNTNKTRNRRNGKKEDRRAREAELKQDKRRSFIFWGILLGASVLAIAGFVVLSQQNTTASEATYPGYPTIDNISCDQLEQTAFHIHAHISLYINGQAEEIPATIGINTDASSQSVNCYYWLHTHDTTGIIHMEAPANHSFILGNFLDIWQQRFSNLGFPEQLNQSYGWTVYVNGKAYSGDYHKIPLDAHTLITMGYNSPNIKPDNTYNWNGL